MPGLRRLQVVSCTLNRVVVRRYDAADRLKKLSANPFFHGLPGAMYNVPTPVVSR